MVYMYLVFQVEQDSSVNDANPHIANIGRMVEVTTVTLITLYCYCLIVYQIVIYVYILSCFLPFLKDMENKMRNTLNDIYFGKTKDIVNALR